MKKMWRNQAVNATPSDNPEGDGNDSDDAIEVKRISGSGALASIPQW
jgi:hypothetical protein